MRVRSARDVAVGAVVRVMRPGRPDLDAKVASVVGERIILQDGGHVDPRHQLVCVVGYGNWRRASPGQAAPDDAAEFGTSLARVRWPERPL